MRLLPHEDSEVHRSVHVLRTRAQELVARRDPAHRLCEASGPERGHGALSPLKGEHGRPHEQLEADERGDRISRQPEDERRTSDAEGERLAGLHRDAPEELLDSELRLDLADEIVRPDGDSPGRDDDVDGQRALERSAMCGLVVFDGGKSLDDRPGRPQLSRQHDSVRLVDLAVSEGLSERAKLGSGREHGGARAAGTRELRGPRGRQGSHLGGADARASGHDLLPGADVSTARTNVGAHANSIADSDGVVMFDNILDRDDGIGSGRHDPSGRDAHRLPRPELPADGPPRCNAADDRQRPGRVLGPKGEPVHGRARKRREVDQRRGRLGSHPSNGLLERNHFGRKRPGALENEGESLVDRQQFLHGRA